MSQLQILKPGIRIQCRYEIIKELGEGGFARVFLARDLELGREVALKFLKPIDHDSEEGKARFLREAKLLSTLRHQNILSVYSINVLDGSGDLYLTTEYLQGCTLSEFIAEKGALSFEECRDLLLQICNGLSYAHKNGVIHRDLGPANVLIIKENQKLTAKIIDFGLSKKLHSSADSGSTTERTTLTKTGVLLGNPAIMSPEACTGQKCDSISDIYSLGCVLYKMLSGNLPFDADNPIALLYLHNNEYPKEPQVFWSGQAEKIDAYKYVALRCLQKKREKRFQSVDEILKILNDESSGFDPRKVLLDSWAGSKAPQRQGGLRSLLHISLILLPLFVCGGWLLKQKKTDTVLQTVQQKVDKKIAYSKVKLNSRLDAFPEKKLRLMFDLGRWQLKSSSMRDLADAESIFNEALSYCEASSAPASRRAACFVLRGKAKWKQEKASEAQADFDSALKLIQRIEDPEKQELTFDYYEELILMHIHQRRFSEVLKELSVSSSYWEKHRKPMGVEMLMWSANQRLDENGDERRQLNRNCAEELQKLTPKTETEAIQMMRIALSYYQVLSERVYRHPPSAAHKMQTFAEDLLKKIKPSPSKTELREKFKSLKEIFGQQDKETRLLEQSQ